MILLDTNVCIGFLHGDQRVLRNHATARELMAIPGMVLGELYYGIEKSQRRLENLKLTEEFLATVSVCHADDEGMKMCGELNAGLEKSGKRVDDADVLIAATAICNNATLATGNLKHFSRFEGLKVENWFV